MILTTHPFLLAATIQTFLYALYLVTLGHALRWLLFEDDGRSPKCRAKINWLLLTTTIVLFVFSTVDMIFEISLQVTYTGGLEFGGRDITQQLIIASIAIESSTLLITDAVLIIRCWLVYQKSWRVACFPFVLWLGNITCMILWVVGYTLSEFKNPIYRFLSRLPLIVFCFCNFATNLYATGAIVYRVWLIARLINRRSSTLYQVCRIVAGTGTLYTVTSFPLLLSAFLINRYKPIYILCNAVNFSVCGITFNLLLIRVGQLRAEVEMSVHEGRRNNNESVTLSIMQSDIPDMVSSDCFLDDSESVGVRQKNSHASLKGRIGKKRV